ncbi:hypothetical protein [Parvularcula maris]|uniref:Uncharacterized protein n=1 Tax=Parvularcula maris TaxID=2965077 RepID=A0A9X2LBQ0_9PROT|nr:hypothetical protein [Parvularcula maris]MCQ8186534.1 hypothetical protein [Parvularcula maris]
MSLIAVLAGAAGAGLTFLFFRLAGIHRNLVAWAVLLVAIACCYPLFAAERFDFSEALWQTLPVIFFAGLVIVGLRAKSPELIGLGFLLHALLDLAGLPFRFHSPLLWAELCLGYDVTAALIVRVLAKPPSGQHLVDVEDEDRTGA